MHIKEPTSLLAKSREKSRWSGQTAQSGSYIRVVRPTGHSYKVNFSPPWQTWGVFHQVFCQCFSLTNFISYWNPCIWLAESKFVSEKHWQNTWWNTPQEIAKSLRIMIIIIIIIIIIFVNSTIQDHLFWSFVIDRVYPIYNKHSESDRYSFDNWFA